MIYLDYSATTPVNSEVLDYFNHVNRNYIGNPNSNHNLGKKSKLLIEQSTQKIAELIGVKDSEIIYTSGASESNNLGIKGACLYNKIKGNHIITTALEHSSIYGTLNYLADEGFEVEFVNLNDKGQVDLEHLKSLIRDTTILVTISAVNSEIGIKQPIEQIGALLKEYHNCLFHVDMTQAVGKINVSFDNIDLASFSAHKFYGLKGIGCLIKKEGINIIPQIHGGKSTTIYRSGTPSVALIASLEKALSLAYKDLTLNLSIVNESREYIVHELMQLEKVRINSNDICIPHILNLSILGVKAIDIQNELEKHDIYVSTQSACSTSATSKAVLSITNDIERAKSSIRISISSLTNGYELTKFIKIFKKIYDVLIDEQVNV